MAERIDPGIAARDVAELGAVPVKYFSLRNGHAPHGTGRAVQLAGIRRNALQELRQAPARLPAALRERRMPWYALSVAPVLRSLATGAPVCSVINLRGPDGLVREERVRLTGRHVDVLPNATPPGPVVSWVQRFEKHERAVLASVQDPNGATIAEALSLDPLLAPADPDRAARCLMHGD